MNSIDALADRSDRLRARHDVLNKEHVRDSVVLIGDSEYLDSYSGQLVWTTLVNLTARLYKGIRTIHFAVEGDPLLHREVFVPVPGATLLAASLGLVESIAGDHTAIVVNDDFDAANSIVVHVGARRPGNHDVSIAGVGWLAFLNDYSWPESRSDENPIGPIVAACLAAAEVYRRLYMRDVTTPPLLFSAFDYSESSRSNPSFPALIMIPGASIAGAGAVGMAVLFALLNLRGALMPEGLDVIDDDIVEDSNLNRCILAVLADVEKSKKVFVIERHAQRRGANIRCHDSTWQKFITDIGERSLRYAISGVDKYESRLSVQYDKMPRTLLTAGTADFLMTISRHQLDNGLACGACYQTRDRAPKCAAQSEGAQQEFEQTVDPSIGFVSVLAGTLLAAEFIKEARHDWRSAVVDNAVRVTANVLAPTIRSKVFRRPKDPNCNCSSKYVAMGYRELWPRQG